jgi:hypothetical protein
VAHRADHFPNPSSFTSGKPLGGGQITLGVGGIAVKVSGIPTDLLPSLQERYAPFLASLKPNHEVLLQTGEPRYLHHSPGTLLRLEEIQDGQGVILVSGNFAARREGARGKLLISDPSNVTDSLLAVENYLRWTIADLVLDREGFLFHASAVVREGRAHVFFGPSGAGKSTIVSLSPALQILSEDMVLLIRADGEWRAATTPFKADKRVMFPIGGLYRLVQAPANRLATMSLGVAVGIVMACCPFVTKPSARHDKLLPLVESCCREAGVWELRFRKDPGFWDLIMR